MSQPSTLHTFLSNLNLEDYFAAFMENEVTWEDLPELTDEDLKELGLKLGPRKRLLKAIADLQDPKDSPLKDLVRQIPVPVATPLREYLEEEHPVARLWAACDTVEMLLRLIVIAEVASQTKEGELTPELKKQLAGIMEMPTLGGWFVMAQHLAKDASGSVREAVEGPLKQLLYGPEKPGTPETSFLRLRNRLAHGGGLMREEAERLITLWGPKLQDVLLALKFLSGWELISLTESGEWVCLQGTELGSCTDVPKLPDASEGDVWLLTGVESVRLWPLALFGLPRAGEQQGSSPSPQLYSRKGPLRLTYTPIGSTGLGESESDVNALREFDRLFQLPAPPVAFSVAGYEGDIRKDNARMVGREAETQQALDTINEKDTGVWWLSGVAGMGKSMLMARLTLRLREDAPPEEKVICYRFRAGDQVRCGREALAQFLVERLIGTNWVLEGLEDAPTKKAEERLENLLGGIRKDRRLVILLDGLDEVMRGDAAFAKEIPLSLRYPRLRWICAGRPEQSLSEEMKRGAAVPLFTEGLPAMCEEEIRGMLLEKIGPLRKKLLQQDHELGDGVVNPFVDLVCVRAQGLPIYVNYVIGDVLAGRYRVLDEEECLPDSLHAYHEELLSRLGIGDLQAVVTPLAASLAVAMEPLSVAEIEEILQFRKLLADQNAQPLLERALTALSGMLRTAPDPEGEVGYTLFHDSLRAHMRQSDKLKHAIQTAEEAFADLAEQEEPPSVLSSYLLRCGVHHLLDQGREEAAREKLLDLGWFAGMWNHLAWPKLYRWWSVLGGEAAAMGYLELCRRECPDSIEKVEPWTMVGEFAWKAGWFELGVALEEVLLEVYETLLGREHPDTLARLNNLGLQLSNKGDAEGAERMYRSALAGYETILGPDHLETMRTMNNLGNQLRAKGELDRAEMFYLRSANGFENLFGPDHPWTLSCLNNIGLILNDKGEFVRAEEMFRKVVSGFETFLGPDHPDTLMSINNLGVVLSEKRNVVGAEEMYRKALKGREKVLGHDHPDTLRSVHSLGGILKEKKDWIGAEELYLRVMKGRREILGKHHPETLNSITQLGVLYMDREVFDKAAILLETAFILYNAVYGVGDRATLNVQYKLGSVLKSGHKFVKAEKIYRDCLNCCEKKYGPNDSETLKYCESLLELLHEVGDFEGVANFVGKVEVRHSGETITDNSLDFAKAEGKKILQRHSLQVRNLGSRVNPKKHTEQPGDRRSKFAKSLFSQVSKSVRREKE